MRIYDDDHPPSAAAAIDIGQNSGITRAADMELVCKKSYVREK